MKTLSLRFASVIAIVSLTACGATSGGATPSTVGSQNRPFSMTVQSIQHTSDASGSHRIVQLLVGENGKTTPMTLTETVSGSNPNLDHIEARTTGGVMTADFNAHASTTDVNISLNGKPYYHTTIPQRITELGDGQISSALAQVVRNHQQEAASKRPELPLALCWAVCAGGVEIEGPFVLACLAACQLISQN